MFPVEATAVLLPVKVRVETPETMLLKLPVTPVGKPLTLRVVEAGTSPPTFVSVTLSVVVAAEAIVRVELPSVSNWPGA